MVFVGLSGFQGRAAPAPDPWADGLGLLGLAVRGHVRHKARFDLLDCAARAHEGILLAVS